MDYVVGPDALPDGDGDIPASDATVYPAEEADTEFGRKYPPDPYGKELEDNARVWRVYRDEATLYDKSMLNGWNKTLDILLIFAGLFSAVVTAFVIESYQQLQPDLEEYIAEALYASLVLHGTNASAPVMRAPSDFTASWTSRWINGLWVTSLVIALAVALLSILVKQWLEEYAARMTKATQSTHHWARRRALYFNGIMDWRVPEFISLLPVALHLALFLFFSGLVLLIWSLDMVLTLWILFCTVFLFVFYAGATVLPMRTRNCPTSTPILRQIQSVTYTLARWTLATMAVILSLDWVVWGKIRAAYEFVVTSSRRMSFSATASFLYRLVRYTFKGIVASALACRTMMMQLTTARRRTLQKIWQLQTLLAAQSGARPDETAGDDDDSSLDMSIVRYLVRFNPSREVNKAGQQAISAVHPASELAALLHKEPDVRNAVYSMLQRTYRSTDNPRNFRPADVSRDIRSLLCLPGFPRDGRILMSTHMFVLRLYQAANCSPAYDLPIRARAINAAWDFDAKETDAFAGVPNSDVMEQQPLVPPFPAFVALRILHSDLEVSISYRLFLVSYLAFEDVTEDDCRGIANVLRTSALERATSDEVFPLPDFSCTRSLKVHNHDDNERIKCTANCFLELLAKILRYRKELDLQPNDILSAVRIIARFADAMASKRGIGIDQGIGNWLWLKSSEIDEMPAFTDFMASDLFNSPKWVYRALEVVVHVFKQPEDLVPYAVSCTALGRALTNLLLESMHARRNSQQNLVQLSSGQMLVRLLQKAEQDPALYDEFLYLTERLLDNSFDRRGQCPWALISRYETQEYVNNLGALISRALCAKDRRGMNVTTLADVFLAGHFRGLLYTACKLFVHQDDYAHLDFAYMVRHCNILRENWWSQEFLPPFMANAQEPADLKWFATRTVGPLTTPRNACTKPCCF